MEGINPCPNSSPLVELRSYYVNRSVKKPKENDTNINSETT